MSPEGPLPSFVAEQMVYLWRMLPPGEWLPEDELWIGLDDAGHVYVRVEVTGYQYRLRGDGVAQRSRVLASGEVEVTNWRDREMRGLWLIPAAAFAAL